MLLNFTGNIPNIIVAEPCLIFGISIRILKEEYHGIKI